MGGHGAGMAPVMVPEYTYTGTAPITSIPANLTEVHSSGFDHYMANNSMASMGALGVGDWNATNQTFSYVSVPGTEHGHYGPYMHMNETDWFQSSYNMTYTAPIRKTTPTTSMRPGVAPE